MLNSSFYNKRLSDLPRVNSLYSCHRFHTRFRFAVLSMFLYLASCEAADVTRSTSAKDAPPCAHHNVLVKNKTELDKALSQACAGSVVRLAEGIWQDLVVDFDRGGSPTAPLVLKADTPGKTFIEGESHIFSRGDYVHITGFYFRNGFPGFPSGRSFRSAIVATGSHNVISENTIDGFDREHSGIRWLTIGGQYTEVSYNRLQNKTTSGVMLAVDRDSDAAQHHHIHHNHFKNFASGGGENGWETIRIGNSKYSQSDSHILVEENRFDACDGEIEIISVKSGRNTLRKNVFVDSHGFLTLRHGKNNIVESNIFSVYNKKGAGGVRVTDDGHEVRNNYIAGVRTGSNTRGGIVLHSGENIPGTVHKKLSGYWTPYNITIANNTIVDSSQSFLFGGKKKYAAENIYFKNNVISSAKGKAAIRVDKALKKASFDNELYYGDRLFEGSEGRIAPGKNIVFDPVQLTRNNEGLWLHSSSGAQGLRFLTESDVGPKLY